MSETRKRARDLGLKIGILEPGPFNAITDVKGVRVGHANVRHGEVPGGYGKGPAITGVTAIIPDDDLGRGAVPAGKHVLNGTGEVTGISEIEGIGRIDTPIMLTNTMGVGIVYDATCRWVIENDPEVVARGGTAIPIVGECNDGSLNDAHGMHVRAEHAIEAIENAKSGPVEEGCVGSGSGMVCFEFKGGIGTSSRKLATEFGGYTVGVLVMSNFGRRPWLTIEGYPVGQRYPHPAYGDQPFTLPEKGSCIVVVATDAPLTSKQLDRIAQRGGLGLARVGSFAGHGSGDFIVAFSTAYRLPTQKSPTYTVELVTDFYLDPLFAATREATEEAVVNSLCMAETTTGLLGHTVEAMPYDWIADFLKQPRP